MIASGMNRLILFGLVASVVVASVLGRDTDHPRIFQKKRASPNDEGNLIT